MKREVYINILVVVVTIVTTILTISVDYFSSDVLSGSSLQTVLLVFMLAVVMFTGITAVRTYTRTVSSHPRSLSIALIGPPHAGKTVYLTMLYKELEAKAVRGLSFAPYGTRTIEQVAFDLTQIRSGKFPPPTIAGSHFIYEAIATYNSSIFSRKYRIQIGDYAGEYLDVFTIGSDLWLHRSEFFSYVLGADAIMIMIDAERLILSGNAAEGNDLARIENAIVAALHTLIEKRSEDPTKQSEMPVVLIISKSDLLNTPINLDEVLEPIERLVAVCQQRFKYFRYFFVSSIGSIPKADEEGIIKPPLDISPKGVVDPLVWILGK